MSARSSSLFGTCFVGLFLWAPLNTWAQIIPDTTLPSPSIVTADDLTQTITGGTLTAPNGGNLFHSFSAFSVPTGTTAVFDHAPTVANVITRVTGASISTIDGRIQAQGTANLFLINPNGVTIGPNAQLSLGGSFLGTTATSLLFADGQSFSATQPQAPPLLAINVPMGLQFGTNPQPIQVQGPGHNLGLSFPFIDDTLRPSGFAVQPGQTLALIGGDLSLTGGNLTAIDGRIELGSVHSPDRVDFSVSPEGSTFDYGQVQTFADIHLSQAASVEVSGQGVGVIQLQGRQISLTDGSTLLARTRGIADGGGLTIRATDTLSLSGFAVNDLNLPLSTSLVTDVALFATGNGGSLNLEASTLRLSDSAFISSGTFGAGQAGDLVIKADTVELIGGSTFGSTAVSTDAFGPGAGGNLRITADTVQLIDGAVISSSNRQLTEQIGGGPAGDIQIDAQTLTLSGSDPNLNPSRISALVSTEQRGGNIRLNTDRLSLAGGANIAASSLGRGPNGDLTVNAQVVELTGKSPQGIASGLFTGVTFGTGGNLTVETQQLRLSEGANISATTFGTGNAGNLQISAADIELKGSPNPVAGGATGVFAAVSPNASGRGGRLDVETVRLRLLNGAQIATSTLGSGDAGALTVTANQIELMGGNAFVSSGLFANALLQTGAGGEIIVTVDQLVIQDGAAISASNFQSQNGTPPGAGPAGDIEVQAQTVQLAAQAMITAETSAGNRGNITLQAENIFLRDGSAISTNATQTANGGNITLMSDLLLLRDTSNITANAVQGQGGNIAITTNGLLRSPDSQITASSKLGVSGVVAIVNPDQQPNNGLVTLSGQTVDVSNLVGQGCQARHLAQSNFVQTGRSGLPTQPTGWLGHRSIVPDVRAVALPTDVQPAVESRAGQQPQPAAVPLVEAQGWARNAVGQLMFVAQVPTSGGPGLQAHGSHCVGAS